MRKRSFEIVGGVILGTLAYIAASYVMSLFESGVGPFYLSLIAIGVITGAFSPGPDGVLGVSFGVMLTCVVAWMTIFWSLFGALSIALVLLPALLSFVAIALPSALVMIFFRRSSSTAGVTEGRDTEPPVSRQ